MDELQMVFPMVALATLTFAVLLLIPIRRFQAGARGEVTDRDFAFGESERVPDQARLANRNYMNLLELPMLFYVVGLLYLTVGVVDATAVALAWTYVGLRVVHSAIHVTYHRVRHRLLAFSASHVLLIMLWTHLCRVLVA
jgi:hypothetical protein